MIRFMRKNRIINRRNTRSYTKKISFSLILIILSSTIIPITILSKAPNVVCNLESKTDSGQSPDLIPSNIHRKNFHSTSTTTTTPYATNITSPNNIERTILYTNDNSKQSRRLIPNTTENFNNVETTPLSTTSTARFFKKLSEKTTFDGLLSSRSNRYTGQHDPPNRNTISYEATPHTKADIYNARLTDNEGATCTTNTTMEDKVPNPELPYSCGIDMVLIIDSSLSINESELTIMKNAFSDFVDAFLPDTPTHIAVVEFDNTAHSILKYSTNADAIKEAISNATSDGCTNWEDALTKAHNLFDHCDKPDLYVFASDGRPNHVGSGEIFVNERAALAPAVAQANQIKSDGVRIITLGIGDFMNPNNLIAISSEDAYYETGFDTLADTLAKIANELCGGTILVKKNIDGINASGWNFTIDVKGGTANQKWGITDKNGFVRFNIDLHENESIAMVNITETLQHGYLLVNVTARNCSGETVGTPGVNSIHDIPVTRNCTIYCEFNNTKLPDDKTPPLQTIELGTPKDAFLSGGTWLDRIGSKTPVWINSTDVGVGTSNLTVELLLSEDFDWWTLEDILFVDDNGDLDKDPTFGIISVTLFMNKSCFHKINATCYDRNGNVNHTIVEFIVDSIGPTIEKEIGEPRHGNCVNLSTVIWLNATDEITVDEYCTNGIVQNIYCNITVNNETTQYFINGNSTTFSFKDEGTNVLEIWAVDGLGNEGEHIVQTHFVDDTPPELLVKIGEPSHSWSKDEKGHEIWDITTGTEINITAIDTGCYPTETTILYRTWFQGNWTDWTMYTQNITFNEQCKHILHVKAFDCIGNTLTDSKTFNVYESTEGTPLLQSPANRSQISDNTPMLVWKGVFGQQNYVVEWSSSKDFKDPEIRNVTGTKYTLDVSLPHGTHYWHIATLYANGTVGEWSDTWWFLVVTEDAPLLKAPKNASYLSSPPTLSWYATEKAVKYRLQVDDKIDFSSPIIDVELTETEYDTADAGLAENVVYYWRVAAIHGTTEQWSDTSWWFIIDTIPPDDFDINKFGKVSGVIQYNVTNLNASDIEKVVFEIKPTKKPRITFAIDHSPPYIGVLNTTDYKDGNYRVYITAYDYAGNSKYKYDVITIDNTPPVIVITSPENATIVSGIITIEFTDSETNNPMISIDGGPYIKTTTNSTHVWNTTEELNGQHFIIIKDTDEAGNTGYSQQGWWVFTNNYEEGAPVVNIVNPINGSKHSGILSVQIHAVDDSTATENLIVKIWTNRLTDGKKDPVFFYNTTYDGVHFTVDIDISNITNGTKIKLNAYATDESGKNGVATSVFQVESQITFDQWMSSGWNTLVLPPGSIKCSNATQNVLRSIEGAFNWVFYRNATTGKWYNYDGAGGDTLKYIHEEEIYYIYMTESRRFSLSMICEG